MKDESIDSKINNENIKTKARRAIQKIMVAMAKISKMMYISII